MSNVYCPVRNFWKFMMVYTALGNVLMLRGQSRRFVHFWSAKKDADLSNKFD